MPLTCTCPSEDDAEWYWWEPDDYTEMPARSRRVRCRSCGDLINAGATVVKFDRSRDWRTDIEERIYGEGPDAIPLASWWLCEECGDLYWSLRELGFCIDPDENMRELVRDYAQQRTG